MKTPLKSFIAALAVSATVVTPLAVAPASAGDNGWYTGSDGVRYHRKRWPAKPRHHRDDDDIGRAAAAAIIGLAAGAVAAGALSQANRPPDYGRRVYTSPYPPAPAGPRVIELHGGTLEPWTAGWYQWCDANYRTFNPNTGTFHGYDGQDHFCVPH